MLKIAVCDDRTEDIALIRKLIEKYAQEQELVIEAEYCWQPQEVLRIMAHANEFDCLFLDIYMGNLNGMEIARHIRRNGVSCQIVFFTSSMEHALDAFEVNASQYLVKPIRYDALVNAMNIVLGHSEEKKVAVSVTVGNRVVAVPLADIIFAETQRNYQMIHMEDGSVLKTRMTCTELTSLIGNRSEFIRLGASYIVNLKYVRQMSANDIELKSGYRIFVPRGCYARLKEKYMEYFMMGSTP